ncbi:MAG TPA: hypothetical protein VLF42_00845 [Burkholderiales bacterium]|nr:hypothetical protein [Burkholderiales bacterium]
MSTEFADLLVWIVRGVLGAGLAWGAWLCVSHLILPERSPKILQLEHFATFAVLVLIFSTLGGLMQAV